MDSRDYSGPLDNEGDGFSEGAYLNSDTGPPPGPPDMEIDKPIEDLWREAGFEQSELEETADEEAAELEKLWFLRN